jgi:hypothetical protein
MQVRVFWSGPNLASRSFAVSSNDAIASAAHGGADYYKALRLSRQTKDGQLPFGIRLRGLDGLELCCHLWACSDLLAPTFVLGISSSSIRENGQRGPGPDWQGV